MTALSRRSVLTAGAAGLAATAVTKYIPSAALADEVSTEAGRQVPFYRSKLGSADITVVSDGTIAFPPSALWPEVPEDELEGYLSANYQPTDSVPLEVNAMVIDLNGRRVLIDAGAGPNYSFRATKGGLPENLRAAGIDPDTIDDVIFTHLHPDHLWGVTDGENEALHFPNAEYVMAESEHAFWGDPDLPGQMPTERLQKVAQTTLAHLASVGDQMRTANATAEVNPGITFVPTPGHTPGHVSILLESDGESLIVSGDVVGNSVVSFEHPEWAVGFDADMEKGAASRLSFLDQAATDRLRVFAYHLPWPGFGRVARSGNAYRWIKEEWDWRA